MDHVVEILSKLRAAIAEQEKAVARTSVEKFENQQGRLFGLEMAEGIVYSYLSKISGEEND